MANGDSTCGWRIVISPATGSRSAPMLRMPGISSSRRPPGPELSSACADDHKTCIFAQFGSCHENVTQIAENGGKSADATGSEVATIVHAAASGSPHRGPYRLPPPAHVAQTATFPLNALCAPMLPYPVQPPLTSSVNQEQHASVRRAANPLEIENAGSGIPWG